MALTIPPLVCHCQQVAEIIFRAHHLQPVTGSGSVMDMTTYRQLVAWLKPMDMDTIALIAKRSGVPYHTLRKLATGETADPKISTVERLQAYHAKHVAG